MGRIQRKETGYSTLRTFNFGWVAHSRRTLLDPIVATEPDFDDVTPRVRLVSLNHKPQQENPKVPPPCRLSLSLSRVTREGVGSRREETLLVLCTVTFQ